MRWTVPLLLCLLAASCGGERLDLARARSEVLQADEAFARAVAARDTAAFGELVAQDATFYGRAILHGREQVVDGWAPLMAADRRTTLTWTPHTAVVAESGELAYTLGDWEMTARGPDGAPVVTHGSYVTVWRRGPDGRWQAVVDSGSPPQE